MRGEITLLGSEVVGLFCSCIMFALTQHSIWASFVPNLCQAQLKVSHLRISL